MTIREMRLNLGDTQSEFSIRYNIPFRTIQNWETGLRKPPEYVEQLLESCYKADILNRRTVRLPKYDPQKLDLPKRSEYVGAISWLKAIRDCIGESFVFALDEALICQGNFGGRNDEFIVWGYGSDIALRFNGVALLGNHISPYNVREKNGLEYTDFNRTIADAIVNESILDMQGTIEALSKYYYENNDSFDGLSVAPVYQDRFEKLAAAAIDYYGS